jgi:hypothetical protein
MKTKEQIIKRLKEIKKDLEEGQKKKLILPSSLFWYFLPLSMLP